MLIAARNEGVEKFRTLIAPPGDVGPAATS